MWHVDPVERMRMASRLAEPVPAQATADVTVP
jgi:hypothetical protein